MGMFDSISIADKLPYTQEMIDLGLDVNNRVWQTKDLDNAMVNYVVQGGRLFETKYRVCEWIKGDENAESVMDRIGYLKREGEYLSDVEHHGKISIYDYVANLPGDIDAWIEFDITFTHGMVEKIELVKFEKRSNIDRKKKEQETWDNIAKERSKFTNKYFFHTKAYRWFTHKIWFNSCMAISKFFNNIAYIL